MKLTIVRQIDRGAAIRQILYLFRKQVLALDSLSVAYEIKHTGIFGKVRTRFHLIKSEGFFYTDDPEGIEEILLELAARFAEVKGCTMEVDTNGLSRWKVPTDFNFFEKGGPFDRLFKDSTVKSINLQFSGDEVAIKKDFDTIEISGENIPIDQLLEILGKPLSVWKNTFKWESN
jgi:hypothetical protein